MSTGSAMHLLPKMVCVFALAVLSIAACAEVTDACPGKATIRGTTSPFPEGTGAPLRDVELCETGTANCVFTDDNGEATLCLPFDEETSFTRSKDGYGSYVLALLIPEDTPPRDMSLVLATDLRLATQHDNVMSRYPPIGTGMIAVTLLPAFAGATFDLPEAAGEELFYTDEELNWSRDLTATIDRGLGGFVEVSPGEHQLVVGGTAKGCVPARGWPGRSENSVRFPVLEDHLSDVSTACDVPP